MYWGKRIKFASSEMEYAFLISSFSEEKFWSLLYATCLQCTPKSRYFVNELLLLHSVLYVLCEDTSILFLSAVDLDEIVVFSLEFTCIW